MKASRRNRYSLQLSKYVKADFGRESRGERRAGGTEHVLTMKRSGLQLQLKFIVISLLAILSLLYVIPAEAQDAELPEGTEVISYDPVEYPKAGVKAADMKPIGVGSVALAGDNIALQVALPKFDGPVDVYCAIQAPSLNPETFLINSDLSLSPLTAGLVKWKDNVTAPIEESLYGIIPVNVFPSGRYNVYLLLTPHGDLSNYMLYSTYFEVPPIQMAPPTGQEIFAPRTTARPIVHTTASEASPIGLGSVVAGEDNITVRIGLTEFSAPVDIYLALDWPAMDPNNIYLVDELLDLSPLSSGLVKWKENVTAPISEIVLSDISPRDLPPGIYKFYLIVTPAGSTEAYYIWSAELSSSTLVVDSFGNGLVTNNTGEINCSEDIDNCSASYNPGTTVVLTATPDADSVFHSWEGCDSVSGNVCTVIVNTNKTVYPSFTLKEAKLSPSVKVLDANAVNLIVKQTGGVTYYFDPQILTLVSLQAQDIIVSTIGDGFMRRVISVTPEEGLIKVETEDASVLDAVEEGDFIASPEDFSVDLEATQLESGVTVAKVGKTADHRKAMMDIKLDKVIFEEKAGPGRVRIVGTMKLLFKPDLKLSIGWKHIVVPYVKQFRSVLKIDNTDDLKVIADVGWHDQKKVPLGTIRFSPIPLGYIVLVPEVVLYVGVEANIGASGTISTGVKIDALMKVGVIYKKKKGWDGIGEFSPAFSFIPPNLSAEVHARATAFVEPEFSLLLYGIVGPYVNTRGYLTMNASAPPLSWALAAGLRGCVGVTQASILKKWLPKFVINGISKEYCVLKYEKTLAQYTSPGVLDVTPAGEFASTGTEGGPFTSKKVYTLKNTGYSPLSWSVSASENWVDVRKNVNVGTISTAQMKSTSAVVKRLASIISGSGNSGELSPGDSVSVVVSLTTAANSLSPGTHTASVDFVNVTSNNGNTSRTVRLTIQASDEPPSVPMNLTATVASSSSIALTWTASTDETAVAGYKIERCTGGGCSNFTQIGTSTAATNYADTGLSENTTCRYRVRAYDNTGNDSGYSNTVSATTPGIPPTVPGNLTATPLSPSEISLNWGASTDEG
ncbi:MAG: fibronectin type III domain-containing protein, partial [Candidatus Sulfobium sp.]